MHDQINSTTLALGLVADNYTTTPTGTGVDCQGHESALVIQNAKTMTGTTPTLDGKIQESDDNSSFSDVSGAVFTQVTDAADSHQVIEVKCSQTKRYLRYVGTMTGTNPTVDLGVSIVLGLSKVRP